MKIIKLILLGTFTAQVYAFIFFFLITPFFRHNVPAILFWGVQGFLFIISYYGLKSLVAKLFKLNFNTAFSLIAGVFSGVISASYGIIATLYGVFWSFDGLTDETLRYGIFKELTFYALGCAMLGALAGFIINNVFQKNRHQYSNVSSKLSSNKILNFILGFVTPMIIGFLIAIYLSFASYYLVTPYFRNNIIVNMTFHGLAGLVFGFVYASLKKIANKYLNYGSKKQFKVGITLGGLSGLFAASLNIIITFYRIASNPGYLKDISISSFAFEIFYYVSGCIILGAVIGYILGRINKKDICKTKDFYYQSQIPEMPK